MSDFNLIDIVNLIRAEIRKTQVGPLKKVVGPAGPQGPQGEAGIQGPQGPRGNDGKQGPKGDKGIQGKKGERGAKGDDGADGVGIVRVEQDIDNAIVVHLTDGNFYTIEMPLINPDGSLAKEVHYKSGGGGGDGSSGTIDLSGYVRRPPSSLNDSWLVYKEGSDGSKLWAPVTTDLVAVNPNPFRDAKGRFAPTPQDLENLKNQRDVNEFLYDAIQKVEGGDINLDGYVSKSGDVMTGPLETPSIKTGVIEPEKWWGVDLMGALNVDNDDKPAVSIMKNGYSQMELSAVGSVSLWNGYTDFQPNDLVTKEYVDGQIDAIPETDLSNYVSKTGGDDMQGPLDVRSQPDTGSRDTSRINTLGVYSNSTNSYLGLGTSGTKVYVGHSDTSFATPIKVPEIQEKNDGDGIAVTGQVTLGSEGTEAGHAVTKGYVDGRVDEVASALPNDAPQPVDIGTQILKITGSRPTGSGGEAGNMLCWKAETGGPANPYNEIKFVVPDTSVIDNTATQIWLKQGNIVQRWENGGGGWFTNGNVYHLSGNVTYGDDLIDGQPVELYYSDPSSPYLDVISKEESKADDRRLQAEIEELGLALETLLTQRTHGKWVYVGFSGDNIPRNAGEFALASDDLSAQDNIITINLTDLNGITIGLSDVKAGDYIEIVDLDEPANYALFTCTKAPEGTGISNIEVALKDKGNNFLVGDTCEIRFFAINQESIELSELDSRYLKLSGGAMAANARINVDQIEPNDPLGYIRYEAGRDKRYPFALANCGMVQDVVAEEVANYFPIGDWSDSEYEPYPDLRAMDDSYNALYEANKKAQEIVDGAQNRRLDALEANASPIFGRRFKYTKSSRPDDGYFYVAGDVVFSWADLDGLVLKHTGPQDFGWNSRIKMTVWNMEGELWYAMELRGASNYSSTHLKFYKEETRFDRTLVEGEEYRVKIEGYW